MPLRLTVGASRKLTDNNYGSRGAAVDLEIELDTGLAADPPRLREEIRRLFGLARAAVRQELSGDGPALTGDAPAAGPAADSGPDGGPRPAGPRRSTPGQCKALYAIARARGVPLGDYLRDRCQADRPEDLTLPQASEAIDALKAAGREPARPADA